MAIDLVIYYDARGNPKPAQLVRLVSDKKAVVRMGGKEKGVHIATLREIKE